MKAANHGGGPRGWLIVIMAATAVLVLVGALFIGGCGGEEQNAVAEAQEDGSGNIAPNEEEIRDVSSVGDGGSDVLTGYSQDQCLQEMTARYGSEETASSVCNTIATDYSAAQGQQLAQVLPGVEQKLGVTPVPGAPPVTENNTNPNPTGDQPPQDPPPADAGTGWDSGGIEITVPGPPGS